MPRMPTAFIGVPTAMTSRRLPLRTDLIDDLSSREIELPVDGSHPCSLLAVSAILRPW